MKNLTLIVHADVQQALADTLRSIKQASGFTYTPVPPLRAPYSSSARYDF